MEHLLDQLNDEQREAVTATEGPVLVVAGAGSGKTRVLTHRAAWLIHSGKARPDQIVAVTFTNKAAEEMKGRIAALLDGDPAGLRMGTFHSLCLRLLRIHAERLGYRRDFVVFDSADQAALMKEVVLDLRLDPDRFAPRALLQRISAARNRLVKQHEIAAALREPGSDAAAMACESYLRKLRSNNAMDFDDLILNALTLLSEHAEVGGRERERTRYLLVDEYQDTNKPQYELVADLSRQWRNLCVVGDDAQSIYRFRGADIGNILRFAEDYPDARVVKLTRNYRSSGRILKAAGEVIRHNRGRIDKDLWTENADGEKVGLFMAETDREEALFAVDRIRALRAAGVLEDLADAAVLYRTNAQSRLLEEALISAGLPYRIYGGPRFYDRKEVKDLMAYLRLAANPGDEVALRRIVNVPPRGLGKTTLESLERTAREEGTGLHGALMKAAGQTPPTRATPALARLVDLLADLRARASSGEPASSLITMLVDRLGYRDYLARSEPGDAESRMENVAQLVAAAQEREAAGESGLQPFLDAAALVSDVESVAGDTGVNLMTLHCAKGLEYPAVFMVGMEENLFPHVRSVQAANNDEIEEERRLCYVGMTRAKRLLVLSCASQRRAFGSFAMNQPSRFLDEIDPSLIEDLRPSGALWNRRASGGRLGGARDAWDPDGAVGHRGSTGRGARAPESDLGEEDVSRHPDDDSESIASLRVGMRVYHLQFGYGRVEGVEGSGDRQKASVRFSGWGLKKLMTRYANLRLVSP